MNERGNVGCMLLLIALGVVAFFVLVPPMLEASATGDAGGVLCLGLPCLALIVLWFGRQK